jgi:hypothetical protein
MTTRASIKKKSHTRAQAQSEVSGECAVCLEELRTEGDRAATKSFNCTHLICTNCDQELYKRADDRCPMCRASRTRASVSAHAGDNDRLRREAMARRHEEQGGVTATIFFPVSDVEHITIEAFRDFTGSLTESRQPELSGPANDPDVRGVVSGLLHVESVPINQFFALTGSLRARNMLRMALSRARDAR